MAFFNRDYARVARLYVDHGWAPPTTDVDAFAAMIARVCEPHFARPLGEISFGVFLADLFRTAEHFDIHMQPHLVLLQKTLLYVEGLGRSLYPQLDLWTTAKPFMETWLLERQGPAAAIGRILEALPSIADGLAALPGIASWLPQAGSRLRALEARQAEQIRRLADLEAATAAQAGRSRRRLWLAAALLAAGSAFIAQPLLDAPASVPSLQASAGLAGSLAGLVLLLRTLI